MNLILCSGNSLRNRDWIEEAETRISGGFEKTYIQPYRHWETGEQWIDLATELPILGETAKGFGDYGVFSKSIGDVLVVQAIEKGLIQPKFLLLTGIPLDYIVDHYPQFKTVLAQANVPTSVIHNQNDKVGTSQAVRDYFGDVFARHANFTFTETPGDTHDYEQYDLINAELSRLISLTKSA